MDFGASVIAKLKNKSRDSGKPFQLCLQLFCQEEFLRKVAFSKYADNLILKGGLFIYALTNFESRATIDIDFLLKSLPNSVEDMKKIVGELIAVNTGNDFIGFEMKDVSKISLEREYNGINVRLIGKIANTKTPFNVDFGVGDIIVPKPEKRLIPTQLDGFLNPEINTYSLESVISEKFDAMLSRLEFTSRMKDYYDIYYIANTFDFDGRKLQEAIFQTLQNRGTNYDRESFNQIISFADDKDMQIKWQHFLKRLKISGPEFVEILKIIDVFLRPVWQAIIDETEFFDKWDFDVRNWNNV